MAFFQKNMSPKDFAKLKSLVLKPDHPSMTRWSSYLRSLDIILRMTCQCVNLTNDLVDNGFIEPEKVPPGTPSLPGDIRREHPGCSLRSVNNEPDLPLDPDEEAPISQTPTKKRRRFFLPSFVDKKNKSSFYRYMKKDDSLIGGTMEEVSKSPHFLDFVKKRGCDFDDKERTYFNQLLSFVSLCFQSSSLLLKHPLTNFAVHPVLHRDR